ncbi:MAG: hypothetical protein JWM68_3832 [Verrucomicrobiales bacterium]|nr:hypothetical protein [Verrucomicrobiales bacterium]
MKPKRRQVKLTFVASNESVIAEILDDEAPRVAELVWNMLPVETKAIHGMYSGFEVFGMVDNPQPAPAENMVQLPLPGELLYFYDPSTGAVGAKKPVGEIVFVYGRGVTLRAHEGVPTHCALFGRVAGDWKYDWTNFVKECRKCRWEGPQVLRIERVE